MNAIRIISAQKLDEASKKKIEATFSKKHDGKVSFSYEIDPNVLGGIRIIDGDLFYDGTVKAKLDNFKSQALLKTSIKSNENTKKPSKKGNTANRMSEKAEDDTNQKLDTDSILSMHNIEKNLKKVIDNFSPSYEVLYSGIVKYAGDGVVKISGLKNAKYGELLEINGNIQAIVLNLEEDEVGAIVLDSEDAVKTNMIVRSTGNIVEVPVGVELLGRVVNPLGVPVDGLGEIKTNKSRPIEAKAPEIIERSKVNQPLQTGLIAIDSMIPIGRGQRELIIGDRQTGKTTIAIDTIINQKGKDVYCVYVAIGQKASTISGIKHTLTEFGAMEYTTIVCSTAKDSSPMQYIAPYAGCAMAEEFMYSGKHVLIIYDDLSKHAVAYRAMSLLLKRPPGREAYPGDVFYLHSRLLERAAKLSSENGGGSLTALPIVETQEGDISAYIPTNIISITDGQIYLESDLFNAGIRPAVNVGLSVSRVGSSAQIKAMKKISGKLRLDLSQYRELAIFAQFGSDLDDATTAMLIQGERTTESLKQEINSPMTVEHQTIILYITMKEMLKKVPVKNIREFNEGFLNYIDLNYPKIVSNIEKFEELSLEDALDIEDAVASYSNYFFKAR